jgi:YVTN family beta-propeller protein
VRALLTALAFVLACAHAPGGPAPAAAPRLYVSNEVSNDVSVVDTATDAVVATIPVGNRPRGLRISPDGRLLYVAVSGTPIAAPGSEREGGQGDRAKDGIAVVDLARGAVVRMLPSGVDPENFDLSPDGRRLYVSNEEVAGASIVDVESARILSSAPVGEEPEGVATRPDGGAVYVTSERASRVTALGPDGAVLGSFAVAGRPRTVLFTRDGALAFVTAEEGGTVSVVDARAHRVLRTIRIEAPRARPMGLALAPDGKTLWVSNGRGGSATAIDTGSFEVLRTVETGGARSWGIAVTPDGKKLYTANGGSNDVSVIDVASGAIRKKIAVGEKPWGLALR